MFAPVGRGAPTVCQASLRPALRSLRQRLCANAERRLAELSAGRTAAQIDAAEAAAAAEVERRRREEAAASELRDRGGAEFRDMVVR